LGRKEYAERKTYPAAFPFVDKFSFKGWCEPVNAEAVIAALEPMMSENRIASIDKVSRLHFLSDVDTEPQRPLLISSCSHSAWFTLRGEGLCQSKLQCVTHCGRQRQLRQPVCNLSIIRGRDSSSPPLSLPYLHYIVPGTQNVR
jgi:hypothetical protein